MSDLAKVHISVWNARVHCLGRRMDELLRDYPMESVKAKLQELRRRDTLTS